MTSTSTTWTEWLTAEGFGDLFGIEKEKEHAFDRLAWCPGAADSAAAWEFYTELRTRITTQRLAYRAGDEATALDSVYRLFELSRTVIKANKGCTHFATLTVRALNTHVRPFTAKWHKEKVTGRLSSADVRFEFRQQLSGLQPKLRKLTHLMGLLVGDFPEVAGEEEEHTRTTARSREILAPLRFGIAEGMRGKDETRREINEKELEAVGKRRKFYGLADGAGEDAVGLSISGGGIRSATFALGVVQQLARRGILYQVDYLSTVSGGGYLGAFISSFLNYVTEDDKKGESRGAAEKRGENEGVEDDDVSLRPEDRVKGEEGAGHPGPAQKRHRLPFGSERDPESRAVRQLRNHSKYLTEGGLGTLLTIVSLIVYGVVTSILLLAPFLLTGVLVAASLFRDSFLKPKPFLPLSKPTTVVLLLLAAGVLLLPLIQNLFGGRKLHSLWEYACVRLAALSALLLAVETLPQLLAATSYIGGPHVLLLSVAAAPFVLGAAGLWLGVASRAGRVVFRLFTLFGPMLMLAAFLSLTKLFIDAPPEPYVRYLFYAALVAWVYSTVVVNINYASPHSFYRDRLARTYLVRPSGGDEAVRAVDPQKLSAMNAHDKAPYHLINCAVNIPNSKDPDLRGRNTDFFVFSRHFLRRADDGLLPHDDVGRHGPAPRFGDGNGHLRRGRRAAHGHAHLRTLHIPASAPQRAPRLLAAQAGARHEPCAETALEVPPPVAWYYFFRELTGLMSEKTAYLNLSDGGHIENLGIYELLRRRCKFVIAVDGEADPNRSFGGLLTLTQLAKIDLGVTIEPDLTDLRMDSEGHGRAHFSLSRIEYPDGAYGLLLYVKSSLTGNESEFLKKYRADNPAFPHQSTAQQLFSETQFEAYRALGEHIAQDLFRSDLVDTSQTPLTVREWFRQLSTHLLD